MSITKDIVRKKNSTSTKMKIPPINKRSKSFIEKKLNMIDWKKA